MMLLATGDSVVQLWRVKKVQYPCCVVFLEEFKDEELLVYLCS